MNKKRIVLFHYHLFKNAGTSIDTILRENFHNRWQEHDPPKGLWRSGEIANFIESNSQIEAISSHNAVLPIPHVENVEVYPIIFLRHPIDRLRSAYEFERKQIAETPGAKKAKQTDIKGYIKWRLERLGDFSAKNFQAYRLSFGTPKQQSLATESSLVKVLEELPFVGIVEDFENSMNYLKFQLQQKGLYINVRNLRMNATQKQNTLLEDRINNIKQQLGKDVYQRLAKENELDMFLYNFGKKLLKSHISLGKQT